MERDGETNARRPRRLGRRLRDGVLYSPMAGRLVLYPTAAWGYRRYLRTAKTPTVAYVAMRKLFGCRDPRPFERLRSRGDEEHPKLDPSGAAPGVASGDVARAVAALDENGYVVLERRVDERLCAELEECARQATCELVLGDGSAAHARFDDQQPRAVRYDLDEADIVRCPSAQLLIADESLLAIAAGYLRAAPVQDLVAMWWSTAVGDASASAAAQEFHFDLDRLRFLKVFVYLTDVTEHNGPHVYVRGTHRGLPAEFRRDGRYADAEVRARFGEDVKAIAGPRGTVFLADTRGLHKGQSLTEGYRLVFQLEFATSVFGQAYSRPQIAAPVPELATMFARFQSTFARFHGRRRPARG